VAQFWGLWKNIDMALLYPRDLQAWQAWQVSRNRLRQLRNLGRTQSLEAPLFLSATSAEPKLLVAVDASTPTAVSAFLKPLAHLAGIDFAVLSSAPLGNLVPQATFWHDIEIVPGGAAPIPEWLAGISAVFSGGHYLRAGKQADDWAQLLGIRHIVAQHGLLAPQAPPLPENAHALVFGAADAEFWASGRSDVTSEVVGSQLLFAASQRPAEPVSCERPVFLGQLHGAELSRKISGGTAAQFCRSTGATYRPHPAETDIQSRVQHTIWERTGIEIMRSGGALHQLGRPVVSIFSTGVLEAAAAGLPSWVVCNQPPAWVSEFWQRYNMSVWGNEPTAPPMQPLLEPAVAVANSIARMI